MDLSPLATAGLLMAGLVAGFINTIAGAGSLLTLPALMLAGLPADVANGTNRVNVLVQSLTAARTFDRAGKLDRRKLLWTVGPILGGAAAGALAVTAVPRDVLEPILLACMVAVALVMVARPTVLGASEDTEPIDAKGRPKALAALMLTGFYGGFLQAGVGLMLIAVLGGVLRYDLVRGNAVKVVVVAAMTAVALVVFLAAGLVAWTPGVILALSSALGAWLAARFAIRRGAAALRWLVLAAVVISTIALAIR